MKAPAEAILQCQFSNWYPMFERNTIKSRIIELSQDFIDYLKEDGVILPSSIEVPLGTEDQLSDDEDVSEVRDGEAEMKERDFTSIEVEMQSAITSLKGEVFLKLNWSAPIDASWMVGGSVKCKSLYDIYLLLKASDRVMFDLEKMFEECESTEPPSFPYTLVIRKWANLLPSMEFRLFIFQKQLVGICQRKCDTYYSFLSIEQEQERLLELMVQFYRNTIQNSFALDSCK